MRSGGEVFGRLAVLFPHLVAMSIDDFTHDVAPPHGLFTPQLLAEIVNNLHTHSPTISFTPLVYYSQELPVFEQWPDLSLIGDGLAFYFRNQKQGAGPCASASCVWGPSDTTGEHAGGCLAGICAEPTVTNVGGEVADIRAWMPQGRPLVVGFYATGHSSLGSPTARYVREIMPMILSQPGVQGSMVFTMLAPCGGAGRNSLSTEPVCTDNPADQAWFKHDFEIEFCAKGCAIRDAYAAAAGVRRLLTDDNIGVVSFADLSPAARAVVEGADPRGTWRSELGHKSDDEFAASPRRPSIIFCTFGGWVDKPFGRT